MKYEIFSYSTFSSDRFHESAACTCPIAGVYVNVFAPQALGAVVGISIAFYKYTAILAGKILYPLLEFLGLHDSKNQVRRKPKTLSSKLDHGIKRKTWTPTRQLQKNYGAVA